MRYSKKQRKTYETDISVELDLDGDIPDNKNIINNINTSVGFFDHMLQQFAKHGNFNLKIQATGDTHIDFHHIVEDTGIILGQAFKEALGTRNNIIRYASMRVPMDESLVETDIDLSSRAYLFYSVKLKNYLTGNFDASLFLEFWRAFVDNCGLTLHVNTIRGENTHHIIEASFKATGIALRKALTIKLNNNPDSVSSTKGIL